MIKNHRYPVIIFVLSVFLCFCSCSETPPPAPEPEDLSMYITDVFEYVYAPGQHAKSVRAEDAARFKGRPDHDVYLGGFGGYIAAGFDHDVPNVEGEYDFEIFSAGIDAEPAVVYVMCDENRNGRPDEDEVWYELKGSEFDNSSTIRSYSLTYYKPESEDSNITWTDSRGDSGQIISTFNTAWTSGWWWDKSGNKSITFTGTRLPQAYVNTAPGSGGEYWKIPDSLFLWGYAENNKGMDYDKKAGSNKFDIGNAVNADGEKVVLPAIRFIKIQTAVFQQAGWLNEISAEVRGARDLHY